MATQVTVPGEMKNDKILWRLLNMEAELKPTARDPQGHDDLIIITPYESLIINFKMETCLKSS